MARVIRPAIPYKGPIYEGIHEGKQIKITGCVPYGADRFTVNLMNGLNTECDDRPLHISVRFKINTVVRNIYQHGSWDTEERSGCFPFTMGRDFNMVILVERNAYQISVNGLHCWSFSHRLFFTRARSIFINGDVSVDRIEFINKITPQVICPPSAPLEDSGKALSCIFPICGGIRPGMAINITGIPTYNPYRFTLNIQKGTSACPPHDVAFQFDVRFYNYSVVRNSRLSGTWDFEETMISNFPFRPGIKFDIVVKVEDGMYVVMVDGQDFVSFQHRMDKFSEFNVLSVQNDVIVTSVRFT